SAPPEPVGRPIHANCSSGALSGMRLATSCIPQPWSTRMKTLRIVGLVAAVLVFATMSVQANDAASGRSELTAATFLQKAAKSGLAEVELGQLAASKSASNAVREFGEQMVAD